MNSKPVIKTPCRSFHRAQALPRSKMDLLGRKIVFSDMDGTLVHLSRDVGDLGSIEECDLDMLPDWNSPFLADSACFVPQGAEEIDSMPVRGLPPSSSGLLGYISEKTLQLVAKLRSRGLAFVIITGARSSTFFERLPYLPASDAYVFENGGRIFVPNFENFMQTAAPIVEDLEWRDRHIAAGPSMEIYASPADRQGALWDLYRRLESDGWACEAKGYSTNFRVSLSQSKGKTETQLSEIIAGLPPELASSVNLGKVDFYPATSGKDKAAEYLMKKHGVTADQCVSMGDDDNDLALAATVSHTYIPGVTAESVRAAVAKDPSSFTVAKVGGFEGTDELLGLIGSDLLCASNETSAETIVSALDTNRNSADYFFPGLLASTFFMLALVGFQKSRSFQKPLQRLQRPLIHA